MSDKGFGIDAVFFGDLGTVITTSIPISGVYQEALVEAGIKTSDSVCNEALLAVNRWLYSRKAAGRFLNDREQIQYRNLLLSKMEVSRKQFQEVDDLILEKLENISYKPVPGIEKLLDHLGKNNIPAVLIANWDSSMIDLLKKHGLKSKFLTVVISENFGMEKPSLSIFEESFDRVRNKVGKVRKTHSVMLGANLQTDIIPAETLKLIPVYFYPEKPWTPFSEKPDDKFKHRVVKDPDEFWQVLERLRKTKHAAESINR
ncbi:MAG: HAD family hydrolase [Candidatus Odinarchaeota archaeon]